MGDRPQHARGVLTAAEVERNIMLISTSMENLTNDLVSLANDAAEKEHAYRVAYAKARLVARDGEGHGPKGRTTNEEADDIATVECDALLRARLIAEAIHQAARDTLSTRRAQLDALRTIAANVRAQT